MVSEQQNKPWYTRVPAISVAVLAFLVGLTTLINNVRDWLRDETKPAPVAAAAKPANPPAPKAPAAGPTAILLTLDRIDVLDDGSNGSTAWSFDIEGGGEGLFSLSSRDYVDTGEEAVARPRGSDPTIARLVLVPGQQMPIKIVGHSTGLISRVSASGSARLRADRPLAPIEVTADKGKAGRFVFHFTTVATPAP